MITSEIKDVAAKTKGWALATASRDGDPHVIPVAFGEVLSDDEILLVDVFMTKTLENIQANPRVAVSIWDMGSLKGYEFKGKAKIEKSGKNFEESVRMVKSMMPQLDAKGAVVIKVDSVFVRTPGANAGSKLT